MAELTPMMKQYHEMKQKSDDCILFFRLGDFYEMFDKDARVASKELDLTLTTRDRGKENPEDRIPMCGIPYHSSEAYIARLVAKGYKVAICEQVEDPALAKGLVRRDITRVISPGTVMESSMLDESRNNYIASVYEDEGGFGICFCDISTGEFLVTGGSGAGAHIKIQLELGRFRPSETILAGRAVANTQLLSFLDEKIGSLNQTAEAAMFGAEAAAQRLKAQFGEERLAAIGLELSSAPARAGGGLLAYLHETQKNQLLHISEISYFVSGKFMELDFSAIENLELSQTFRSREKKGSLLWVLDDTKTPMGGRLIRSWLEAPLLNPKEINARLGAVDELKEETVARKEARLTLRGVADLERLIGRIVFGTANCRDLISLCQSAKLLPGLIEQLQGLSSAMLSELLGGLDPLTDISGLIERAIADDPPFSVREGGIIKEGYNDEVDKLRAVLKGGKGSIAAIEAAEREKLDIKGLKIGYNKVFGYYIEVTKSNLSKVPDRYIRKQTLVNCERYFTEELKELETAILSADDRICSLEYSLFEEVRSYISAQVSRVKKTAASIAKLDLLLSFASVAVKNNYCRPEVDYSDVIEIKEGRHPVVEKTLSDSLFVPNDTYMDKKSEWVSIITGPNMAGKSTYMRQVALISLMAQIGSFVPAKYARIGVVDRIFTRIGASDDLSSGKSTFMVEMTELADILKSATSKSLLILDEIGRGTSTYDGMAIARAVLEYAADKKRLQVKTLFATHYHELTELEDQIEGVRNYNIAVKKRGDEIIFLRKIIPGGADDSYGVEVAKLAGVPDPVVKRAHNILRSLESRQPAFRGSAQAPEETQLSLDRLSEDELVKRLGQLDLNTLTPIEAMNLLFELKAIADRA